MYKKDCIFCQIALKKAPAHVIWESEHAIAFLDIFPNTSGFTVVAMKQHFPSYAFENHIDVLVKLIQATKQTALLLDAAFEDVARCGMFFEGYGVDHLHSKLFPMHGTGDMKEWQSIESNEPEYFPLYPGYLSSKSGKRVNDVVLAKLAKTILKQHI